MTLTNERGKIKINFFDGLGRLETVHEKSGADTYETRYTYDAAGSLRTVVNHFNHTTVMDYDLMGRKISMQDPNMGSWSYTPNKAGDLISQTDAKNQVLCFEYDSLGRPLTKKQATSAACTTSISTLATWTYDVSTISPPPPGGDYPVGRLTKVVDPAVEETKFAYDKLGRVISTHRKMMGVNRIMAQSYDALGRIRSETFPDGEVVNYNYNTAGWLQSVTASPTNYINDIQYNARGQKTTLQYGNMLTTTWTYFDQSQDPKTFRVKNRTTSGSQQSLDYSYDPVGNITSIADNVFTADRTFEYDDLNRLSYASGAFSGSPCTYTYNAIGNITSKCGITYTYGDANHPSAVTSRSDGKTYSYDNNGNMISGDNRTLGWDVDNRLANITVTGVGTTSFEYDYTGMRVEKAAPSGTTIYPFQGYEVDPNGVITKFIRIGIETFASKRGSNSYFYHNDHLGGVNVITDTNGNRVQLNEYDPWGKVSRSEGSNVDPTHRFTGKELDPESGLYYYGGRYYDPELGRFISPDPFIPEPSNPQSLNRYSYVLNNPVNLVDPDGHFFWAIVAIVKAIITAIVNAIVEILTYPLIVIPTGSESAVTITVGDAISTAVQGIKTFQDLARTPSERSFGAAPGSAPQMGPFANASPIASPGTPSESSLFNGDAGADFNDSTRSPALLTNLGSVRRPVFTRDDFPETSRPPIVLTGSVFYVRPTPFFRQPGFHKPSQRPIPREAQRLGREKGPPEPRQVDPTNQRQPWNRFWDRLPRPWDSPEPIWCGSPHMPGCGGFGGVLPPTRVPGNGSNPQTFPIPELIPDPSL